MTDTSTTRAVSVAEVLRERIFDGRIQPDSHLMELVVAKDLGVSRTPVRDALARLAEEGLLIYQPNKGFLVRRFGIEDVRHALTLRAGLEALACRLIGEQGLSAFGHERLVAMLEEQHAVVHGGEWTRERSLQWHDLNIRFHYELLELAGNPWLTEAVRRARRLPPIFDSASRAHGQESIFLKYQREHTLQAYAEHVRIVDMLLRRENARAETLMQEHVLTNRDVLVSALRKQAATSSPPGSPSPAGSAEVDASMLDR